MSMTEAEELELLELEAEEAAASQTVAAPIRQSQPQQPQGRGFLATAARQLERVPAAIRGSIEGLQDFQSPLGPAKKAIQGFRDPDSVQSFSTALQRAGVDNKPQPPPMRYPGEVFPGGEAPMMGLADQGGLIADLAVPTGLELIPAAKIGHAAAKFGAGKLAPKAEAAANRIQQTVLRPRAGDWNSGAKIENIPKYGIQGGVDDVIKGADEKIKAASASLREAIQTGADEGASVNLYDVIDKAKAKLAKEGRADLVAEMAPAFSKFRRWAAVESQRGKRAIGEADLMASQEFKQMMGSHGAWEKTAAAKNLGISQAEKYQSQAAQAVYLELKEAIEAGAPDGVRELNKTLSDLIPIRNAAVYRKIVADRNNPIQLSDMMSAMTAVGNGPAGAAMLAATRFTKSGLGAKTMYSVASSLRKLSGAKNASEAKFYVDKLKAAKMSEEEIADALQEIRRPLNLNSPGAPDGRKVIPQPNVRRSLAPPQPAPRQGLPPRESILKRERRPLDPYQPDQIEVGALGDVRAAEAERAAAPLAPRRPVGDIPSNFPASIPEDPRVAKVLDGTGRRPLSSASDESFLKILDDATGWPPGLNEQKIEHLVATYHKTKPSREKEKILSWIRAEFSKAEKAKGR